MAVERGGGVIIFMLTSLHICLLSLLFLRFKEKEGND